MQRDKYKHFVARNVKCDTLSNKDQIKLCTEKANGAVAQYFHFLYPDFQPPLGAKMTSHVKLRRERVGLVDYETQIKGNVIIQ